LAIKLLESHFAILQVVCDETNYDPTTWLSEEVIIQRHKTVFREFVHDLVAELWRDEYLECKDSKTGDRMVRITQRGVDAVLDKLRG